MNDAQPITAQALHAALLDKLQAQPLEVLDEAPRTRATPEPTMQAGARTSECACTATHLKAKAAWHSTALCMMHCKNLWTLACTLWPLRS